MFRNIKLDSINFPGPLPLRSRRFPILNNVYHVSHVDDKAAFEFRARRNSRQIQKSSQAEHGFPSHIITLAERAEYSERN